MKEIFFESNPWFIVLCVGLGLAYAFLLYQSKHPWPKWLNHTLTGLRALLVFLLAFLLLSPIIRQIQNSFEKPVFVFLYDNSTSVKETTDSVFRNTLVKNIQQLQQTAADNGHEVSTHDILGEQVEQVIYNATSTDIQGALRKIANQYEGQSIAGVVLVSDGIYNSGLSPLYSNYNFPIYTVGVGDSSVRRDIILKDLIYNKIAYQGNKFTIRAEVVLKDYTNENISISLMQAGKILDKQSINSGNSQLLAVDFTPIASEKGIQRFDVVVETKADESNTRNNRATAFVEVVEGKKKILVVANAPHPDIKALRAVVEKNPNYDFILHIPGVQEAEIKYLQPQNVDLVILHQLPDKRNRLRELYQQFSKSRTAMFLIVGPQSDLSTAALADVPLKFEQGPRQFDDVTPVINPAFTNFQLAPDANTMFGSFPPVWVPFGKMQVPALVTVLLYQRVGSLATDKPLLWMEVQENKKVAVLLAEGFWKWRLHEFSKSENNDSFDEVFGKLIQYLSTAEDKRKFKSYPIAQQFSETEPVIIESQVYNEIYEPIFGNVIKIELTDEQGKRYQYSYTTSLGNARYQIGGLAEGVYRYKASTELNKKVEEVQGQFLVSVQQTELQNLTADFNLLRKISGITGGQFYKANELDKLKQDLGAKEATATIHSEERYDALLNLKWVFFLLLLLASMEWFLRKFFGSY
jgi:hypothetical protein